MKKILCIGEALIDMICSDTGVPLKNGTNFLKKAGGAPTNVAAAIGALGGKVELSAKVGNDPFGHHLEDVLKGFKVGTRYFIKSPNHFTTLAFVSLMKNGERDFYFNRGADGQLSKKDIEPINFSKYSIAHFGSATGFLNGPLSLAYSTALKKAKEAGCFISFDPNYRNLLFQNEKEAFIRKSWAFMKQSHMIKLSDEEACMITGKKNVEDAAHSLLSNTHAIVTITLGSKGTLLGVDDKTHVVASIPVKPVDTTGAGDAFVGAVLYQLSIYPIKKLYTLSVTNWQHIVENANKAGARTCEYMGAMEAFKYLSKDIFN